MSHSFFRPQRGANQKVSATTSAATITIGKGSNALRAINTGTAVGYFVTYNSTLEAARTATNADTPLGVATSNSCIAVIQKDYDHDTISYLSETGGTTLHFQPGNV